MHLLITFGIAGSLLLALDGGSGRGAVRNGAPLRLDKSSRAAPARALALSTASLYAKNDLWKPYLAGEATCPGGERTDLPLASQEETLVCLVNWARRRRGIRPLVAAASLNASSREKARDIARCEAFAHSPCGRDWAEHVRAAGIEGPVGENLYLAVGPWRAPRVTVDGWLNSPNHRAVLFAVQWRRQGIAAAAMDTFLGRRGVTVWVSEFSVR